MSLYLLEIGCEELPARFLPNLLDQLQQKFQDLLTRHHVAYGTIKASGTYRRLSVSISDIAAESSATTTKLKGPLLQMAVGPDGAYLPPALGFMKKFQLQEKDLQQETENGKTSLIAYKTVPGQPVGPLLSTAIPELLVALSLPVAMKWGKDLGPFVRPVHWIVSLLDHTIIPFHAFGITAGNTSFGHRFLTQNSDPNHIASGAPFQIADAHTYPDQLAAHWVKTNDTIRQLLHTHPLVSTLEKNDDFEQWVEEVSCLTEWPTLHKEQIPNRFHFLPQETIISCIKKHQKFFPIVVQGTFQHHFIMALENVTTHNLPTILEGNRKVLTARLEDVAYFWQEDLKTPLESKLEKLKAMTFQKGLGTLHDKVMRLESLSHAIGQAVGCNAQALTDLSRAAKLCKADLTCHMVYEMPDLQGIMGGIYAKQDNESDAVSTAIRTHYSVSSDPLGSILGLADRLDTISACFSNNLIPTGSQDPWGVRRAIYESFKLIDEHQWPLNLLTHLQTAYTLLNKPFQAEVCLPFITQRLKTYIDTKSFPDIADAVISAAPDSLELLRLHTAYDHLVAFRQEDPTSFKLLTDLGVRVSRLAASATEKSAVSASIFVIPEEKTAYDTLQSLPQAPTPKALSTLIAPLTAYFEKVLVMDPDPKIKSNRLAFLKQVDGVLKSIAQFEKISL